jgi:ubiquinone/menaquinone biosynthesis C-methylase UbiE
MTASEGPRRTAKEQFDRQAVHYNAQWNQWTEESLAWLLDHSECRATDAVLDVATGTGFTALAFAPHVGSVIGLDVSIGMLEQARKRAEEQGLANARFTEGAAEAIPFPDESFDVVTCRIAPHHFLSVPTFLAEARRVLKPDGRLLIADTSASDDPAAEVWQNRIEVLRDPSHVRNYTREEWRQMVTEAGFTLELLEDASGRIPITLKDWLIKAGCTPEQTAAVRHRFETAPKSAHEIFRIQSLPDGDIGFAWLRVVLKAVKGA